MQSSDVHLMFHVHIVPSMELVIRTMVGLLPYNAVCVMVIVGVGVGVNPDV